MGEPGDDLCLRGRLPETGRVVEVRVRDGRIARIAETAETVSAGDGAVWLAPGFCDLQVNGWAGRDFNAGAWADPALRSDEFTPVVEELARHGVPLFCPTIVTDSADVMRTRLASLARAIEREPVVAAAVPGIHLEGPYISPEPGPVGAHPPEHVRKPDRDEFRRMQDAAGGHIRIVTLAPEAEDALPFIEWLVEAGVVVGIGHTGASPEVIRDAVLAGATLSTHLGNGAHAVLPRHPNYIWEQLAADGLYASVIADGHHLPAAVVKVAARVKGPDRLVLVSDAVALGGMPPGVYADGRFEVLPTGKVVLAGTPYLAGAGHLLDTGVANAVRTAGLSLAQAVRSVTRNPAELLGLGRKGALRVGADADLTLFRVPADGPLETVGTVCAGRLVYGAPGPADAED